MRSDVFGSPSLRQKRPGVALDASLCNGHSIYYYFFEKQGRSISQQNQTLLEVAFVSILIWN